MICAICGRDGRGLGFNTALPHSTRHFTYADHKHIQATDAPFYLVAACSRRCLEAIAKAYREGVPMKTNDLEERALAAAGKAAGKVITEAGLADAFKGMDREVFAAVVRAVVHGFTEHMSAHSPDIREPMKGPKK